MSRESATISNNYNNNNKNNNNNNNNNTPDVVFFRQINNRNHLVIHLIKDDFIGAGLHSEWIVQSHAHVSRDGRHILETPEIVLEQESVVDGSGNTGGMESTAVEGEEAEKTTH